MLRGPSTGERLTFRTEHGAETCQFSKDLSKKANVPLLRHSPPIYYIDVSIVYPADLLHRSITDPRLKLLCCIAKGLKGDCECIAKVARPQ
jgi:hypothetical protein